MYRFILRALFAALCVALAVPPGPLAAQVRPRSRVLVPGGIDVEPKDSGPVVIGINGSGSVTFTLSSNRLVTDTWSLSCVATGSVTGCTSDLDTITLGTGESEDDPVTFTTGSSSGPGALILYATGPNDDSGSVILRVVQVVAPGLAHPRQPDSVMNRAHCVTGSAGIGAWSCGDAIITLETPGITTLDRTRALTLAHVSGTAAPRPLVAVNVTLPDSEAPLDHLTAVLTVNDTVRTTATYVPWTDSTRQIVLGWDASAAPTGAYPYTLTLTAEGSGDSASTSVTGNLFVVNRGSSPYGAGWEWLGVERLIFNQPVGSGNSHILWVDGDGSAKLYTRLSSSVWVAPHEAYQDTITFASGEYTRTLRHGVQVIFDSTGRHIRTSNRATQVTHFFWGSATQIDSIQVPPAGTSGQTFKLHYTTSKLDSVMVPGVSGRDVGVTVSSSLLTQWRWPDGTYFHFHSDAAGRVDSTTDVRGGTTKLHYSALGLIDTAKVHYIGDSAVTVFVPWQAAGYASGSSGQIAKDTALAVTTIFGPRVGVADDAVFHVDKWGAPIAVKDPLGVVTKFTRGDTAVPALVTRIDFPNSRRALMTYTRRGNLDTLVDSTWGGGQFPTLRTKWDYPTSGELDSPSQVTARDGTASHYHYNSLGLTDSMLDPRGHVTRFTFETSLDSTRGQILTVSEDSVRVWIQADTLDETRNLLDTLRYDAHGNTVRVVDPAGGITKYARDAAGRPTQMDNAVGFRQTFVYDSMDRVRQKIAVHAVGDSSSHCDSNAFTCANDILDALNPSGTADSTIATYTQGLLTQVRDPRGVLHSYRYDLRGLLVADLDEAGAKDSAVYDQGGLISSQVTRHGKVLTFTYDVANRLTKWKLPPDTTTLFGHQEIAKADSVVSTYDSLGNLLRHSDRHQLIKRTYFENGALRTEVDSGPFLLSADSGLVSDSVQFAYDGGGRLDTLRFLGGDTVRYTFKASGDLDSLIAAWYDGTHARRDTFEFAWDSLGRRRQVKYPYFGMTATSHYDALGTLRYLESVNSATTDGNRFNVKLRQDSVDVLGRPLHQLVQCPFSPADTAIGAACGGWMPSESNMRYNRLGALVFQDQNGLTGTRTAVDTFRYDQSGNRIWDAIPMSPDRSHRFVYPSASNRLSIRVDSIWSSHDTTIWTYTYDSMGGRRRAEANGVKQSEYQYDASGRMTGSSQLIPVHDTLLAPGSCKYDADGRAAAQCGGGAVTLLGANVVHDPLGWRYIMGPGIDEPILAIRRSLSGGGELVRLDMVSDGRGQLVAVADSSGFINSTYATNTFNPGPWGTSGTTSRQQTFGPRRWTTDAMGEVSTFRNRQYDPQTGSWLQEDRVGLGAGVNVYQYNGNNPASFSDPFGLCPDVIANGKSVQINANLVVEGGTPADATAVRTGIQENWSGKIGGYDVSINLSDSKAPTILVKINDGPRGNQGRGKSGSAGPGGGGSMYLGLSRSNPANAQLAAHEFGHTLGNLPDATTEGVLMNTNVGKGVTKEDIEYAIRNCKRNMKSPGDSTSTGGGR